MNELKRNRSSIFALIFLTTIIFLSIFARAIPINPNKLNVKDAFLEPSKKYLFGIDEVGRNYLVRCIYGGRVSLLVGFLSMLTSVTIGVALGTISGYFGGKIDNFLMRFVDLISSIPWIILVTVISLFFKPGIISIVIVLGFFTWMEIARLVRAETMSFKEKEFVQYAIFLGENPFIIILYHILPSILPTIITAASSTIASSIMAESALSFLGLGIQQPTSSWGNLLQSAQLQIQKAPYMSVLPGLFIFLTVFSFNKLGDVLRVYFEPKLSGGED